MKKTLVLIVLCFVLVSMLASCDIFSDKQPGGECIEHVDADKNLVCDVCEAELEAEKDPVCTEHVDADKNNLCDDCNTQISNSSSTIYTVKFDTDGAGTIPSVKVVAGSVAAKPEDPEKLGYTFLGWYKGDAEYDFSTKVTANVTLKAKWQIKEYTLTLGDDTIAVTYTQAVGALPAVPAREGYTGKWMLGGAELTADTVYNYTENMTAEADYTINVYTVKYIANGEVVSSVSVEYGSTAANPGEIFDGGYHVSGWTLDGVAFDFTTLVKSDMELVAVISPNIYEITLGDSKISVIYGQAIGTLPAVPARDGYTGKWTLDGAELTADTVYNYAENKVAEVEYTINTYNVILNINGSETTATVNHGQVIELPEVEIPTGYVIKSWTNGNETYDIASPVTSDLNLVAVLAFVETDYKFDDANDLLTVGKLNISDPSITEDAAAKDGYAVLGTTTFNGSGSGLTIHFDHIDISEYLNIFVRVKTTNGVDISANGKSVVYGNYSAYTYVDILPALAGETHLDYIQISRKSVAGINIYVDEIIFVDEPYLKDNKVEFTTIPSTSAGYTSTDVDGAVQITGKAWVYDMYNLGDGVNGADIQTLTIRFKIPSGDGSTPVMKFFSGSKYIYVDLRGHQSGDGIVSCETDAEGYTLLTLNFAAFSRDSGDTWLPAERATLTLTDIGIGCNNATGKPIFDYVAFNVVELPEISEDEPISKIEFSASNTVANDYTLTDTVDGALQLSNRGWGTGAKHTLERGIDAATISSLTFRFKVTGGESAIVYLNGLDAYYLNLSGGVADFAVSKTVDSDGYTLLTIDFAAMFAAKGGMVKLTDIVLKCNNATGAPTFDYIAIEYKA